MDREYARRRSVSPDRRDRQGGYQRSRDIRDSQNDRSQYGAYRDTKADPSLTLSASSDNLPIERLDEVPSSVPIPSKGKAIGPTKLMTPKNVDGAEIMIAVNHYSVQSLPCDSNKVYQYTLRFRLPTSSQRRGTDAASKQQIARAFITAQGSRAFGPDFVFDNVSKGYSLSELTSMEIGQNVRTTMVSMPGHTDDRPNEVEITLRNDGPLDFGTLAKSLHYPRPRDSTDESEVNRCMEALKVIFRDFPANRAGMISPGTSTAFFRRAQGIVSPLPSTGGILEALNGVHQSLSISFGQLCLNVDTACSAFYKPDLKLLDAAKTFAQISPRDSVNSDNMANFRGGCDRLSGLYFVVKHQQIKPGREKNKMRVRSFTTQDATNSMLEIADHETKQITKQSVAQYFEQRYNIRLQYPNLPLVTTARDGMFPLELCYTAAGERYTEPLQGPETADFIKACTVNAHVRRNQITQHLRRLQWHTQPVLRNMGLSVSTKMLEVRAKRLMAPRPVYGNGSDNQAPTSGFWNLKNKKFKTAKSFQSWGLLYLPKSRPISDNEMQGFCRALVSACGQCGMQVPTGPPAYLKGNLNGSIEQMIEDLTKSINRSFGVRKRQVILVLFHLGTDPALYRAVKNVCELSGIVSQCLIAEKSVLSRKGLIQYVSNVALKMNAKLGGINWTVKEELHGPKVMMLGGDVSHPRPAELRRLTPPPSFCALVGSMDSNCALYSGVAAAQAPTQEFMSPISAMFEELLNRFKERNECLPEHIVYWRDGLSSSQDAGFKESELKAILDVRSSRSCKFKLTVINCVKRHHTRLFPRDRVDGDEKGNVLPGTVVENDLGNNDFFIVTQKALQGCAVPCHYISVYDENKLSASQIQRLVMAGTFGYQRATRSVSLHPAVYYAHQVAERAKMHTRDVNGQTVLKNVHKDLAYTMYWQ